MQKLLRRSPVLSPSLSAPPISSSKPSLSTFPISANFLSLGFYKTPFYSSSSSSCIPTAKITIMPHSSSLHHPCSSFRNPTKTHIPSPTVLNSRLISCRICSNSSSSIDCKSIVPSRAWVVLKETGKSGPRSAWFGTVAAGGGGLDKGGDGFPVVAAVEGSRSLEVEGESEKCGLEERPVVRVQRRPRGDCMMVGNPDLLTIPGVGPRNLMKLVQKGFEGVAQLKQLYKDKFSGESSEKMVEFLRSSVGIIHKNHAESITTFIKESVDEELTENNCDPAMKSAQKKRLTFCVEGNISVGKSTFLQRIANETLELRDLVEIVPEPVDKWQNVGPDHFNILDAFYAEPQRYAYTFQNYVFVTRAMQERESSAGIKPLRLMERSVFSDRMVFVRAVHEAKWMNEMEISIYDSWFDPVVSCLPGLIPDAFIYLRASPDTCHKRMMLRKRDEEGGVSLEYLRDLHEKHESWLFPSETGNQGGVLSVTKPPHQFDSSLHPNIKDRVYYLEGDHMHSSIQKVPALVLDCEPNIDFSKDIEAKQHYACQVAEFFEFVKKKKEECSTKDVSKMNQPQVLMPPAGDLWIPGGKNFPESALKSLDFRQAMSLMSR